MVDPHSGRPDAGKVVTVTTPADVDQFVNELADPRAGIAFLEQGSDGDNRGQAVGSHTLAVGAHSGYGYLSYAGVDGYLVSAGDPESPEWEAGDTGYPAGSGVPVWTAALQEYLDTGRRPESITWQDR